MVQLATVPGNEIFNVGSFWRTALPSAKNQDIPSTKGENMVNFPSPMIDILMDINSSPVVAEFDEWDPVAGL